MKFTVALAGLLTAGVVLPAAAQTTEYYVVQDAKSHHCSIVDKRPVSREMEVVGPGGVIYHTRGEAETAMKTIKVCTND